MLLLVYCGSQVFLVRVLSAFQIAYHRFESVFSILYLGGADRQANGSVM